MRTTRALLPLVALALLPLPGFAFIYSAESVEGWVVDAESGKPLQGVVVVAHWQLKGGFEGGNPVGQVHIYEAITDQAGRYYVPAWGPRFALMGTLTSESPGLLYYKAAYKYRALGNSWRPGRDNSVSDWNKKTVMLEPFKGTPLEYSKSLERLNDTLWGVGHAWGDPCGWRAFPGMLRAIDAQDAEFRRAGIGHSSVVTTLRANDGRLVAAGCGSIDEVLHR
jgi:hypothetical protein